MAASAQPATATTTTTTTTETLPSTHPIDPVLHRLVKPGPDLQIDPALFEIEGIVNDVRRGKVKLDDGAHVEQHHDATAAALEEDEIDPTLREIVNSLTNAQQSSAGPNLTHAQAAAAIGAHLTDNEERERLQQSLQTTLEDLTEANFGSLFPSNYPESPHSPFLLPSEDTSQGESSTAAKKKGRGRPKGSKNKPKLHPVSPPPKPPKPPARPRGRPPKPRTPEEQADFEQRKEEKALGIKRKKGRPRKFPGYLVREMRLKKNRAEFNDVIKRHEQGLPLVSLDGAEQDKLGHNGHGPHGDQHIVHSEDGGVHVHALHGHPEGHHGEEVYAWPGDDQSLLDAVGATQMESRMDVDDGAPSGLGKADGAIREVFGLGDVEG